jgi:hypothetical protein
VTVSALDMFHPLILVLSFCNRVIYFLLSGLTATDYEEVCADLRSNPDVLIPWCDTTVPNSLVLSFL